MMTMFKLITPCCLNTLFLFFSVCIYSIECTPGWQSKIPALPLLSSLWSSLPPSLLLLRCSSIS